jgi:hypothetical protein
MELWAGMVDARIAGEGAYVYCAGEAGDLPDFLSRLTGAAAAAGIELRGIDWIARHATLPEPMRLSEAITDVVRAALDRGVVAFDHAHSYPDDDPDAERLDAVKAQLEGFVGDWFDGAVDAYDAPFDLAGYAFVAELGFAEGSTVALATASRDPADLLRRAIDALEARD